MKASNLLVQQQVEISKCMCQLMEVLVSVDGISSTGGNWCWASTRNNRSWLWTFFQTCLSQCNKRVKTSHLRFKH